MDLTTALRAAATRGDFAPAEQFLAELHEAHEAKMAAKTKIVMWVTESGKIAMSQPKTDEEALDFKINLILQGKADEDIEILDK